MPRHFLIHLCFGFLAWLACFSAAQAQDGLADIVILIPYEKVKVLRQVAGKDFEELDIAPPGGTMEQPWLSSVDVDGDGKSELLLPQKNFLRAVVLQQNASAQNSTNRAGWTFKVKEQINGTASAPAITRRS